MSQTTYPENYIQFIQLGHVVIANITLEIEPNLRELGATISENAERGYRQAVLKVASDTDDNMAELLSHLRDLHVLFLHAPSGWSPAAIFQDLRDKDLVAGEIQAVTWRNQTEWYTFSA